VADADELRREEAKARERLFEAEAEALEMLEEAEELESEAPAKRQSEDSDEN
jgi:hypothetical protein